MDHFDQFSDEQLLSECDRERQKFTRRDDQIFFAMIDELIRREVYPKETLPGNPNTVRQMVEGWGAFWVWWSGRTTCPHCQTDLRDLKTGPPFKREIGIYSQEQDQTISYCCPDCGKEWDRYTER